ncbi:hypothetical protein M0R45_001164 [Rubus argutus]|uniref:Uncharacterized protein n=1 Tax=Rubus argutus TaxID=59490 RepID=A0AAW1VMB8_RUBAR
MATMVACGAGRGKIGSPTVMRMTPRIGNAAMGFERRNSEARRRRAGCGLGSGSEYGLGSASGQWALSGSEDELRLVA